MSKNTVSTIIKVGVTIASIVLTFVEKKLADKALDTKVAEKVAEVLSNQVEES